MAEVVCPACKDTFKNQHGLSLHIKRWCKKRDTIGDLLQQHQEHISASAEEEKRRLCLEAEQQAEREQIEREKDALWAQRHTDFEMLAVRRSQYHTGLKNIDS